MLITADEAKTGLPPDDARARHLRETVGLAVGGSFHVGVENGLRGIATITTLAPQLTFAVAWEKSLQARLPLTVLVGLPRPQTAKKVLHDLASLGAARIVFFESAKGDPGYLTSSLWKDGEWREHVLKGAEQACSTLVPEVTRVGSLAEALIGLDANAWKLALDPYEATGAPEVSSPAKAAVLAIGPERGFAEEERTGLRNAGFAFAHLGDRILRVEAAALVGGALMLAQLRVWEKHESLGG
ncbi:MAG: RsmE family RNA methyltransferase [Verrucomicrobiota bacterium]